MVENEVEGEKTGDQKNERAELACREVAATSQSHRKDGQSGDEGKLVHQERAWS